MNIFLIHESFGNAKEHYFKWLTDELSKSNNVIATNSTICIDKQDYTSWSDVLKNYKEFINEHTIFTSKSIVAIFIVKYLIENELNTKTLVVARGFNGFVNINEEYDYVNKMFLLNEINGVDKYVANRICIYLKNGPYVPYYFLGSFAKNLNSKEILTEEGSHCNSESGYGENFSYS